MNTLRVANDIEAQLVKEFRQKLIEDGWRSGQIFKMFLSLYVKDVITKKQLVRKFNKLKNKS
jgi:hypothetical protein